MENPKNMRNLTPLKNYTPPSLPTLDNAGANIELLKNLPRRRRKKAAIAACLGIAGFTAFTGCGLHGGMRRSGDPSRPFHIVQPIEGEFRVQAETAQAAYETARAQLETAGLNMRMHMGGAGASSYYIVYFTEQEALGFIIAKLEAAGLHFSANTPDYSVDINFWGDFGLSLWDEQKNVGISHVNWAENSMRVNLHYSSFVNCAEFLRKRIVVSDKCNFGRFSRKCTISEPFTMRSKNSVPMQKLLYTARMIAQEFAKQHEDILVGVFYSPEGRVFGSWELMFGDLRHRWQTYYVNKTSDEFREMIIAEREPEVRQSLIDNLTSQVQEFIEFLQSQCILQQSKSR